MAFKPYKTYKNDRNIYAKYDKAPNARYVDNGNVKVFGFRSGKIYKMLPASIYYIFAAYYVFTGVYGEFAYFDFEPMDYILTVLKYIFYVIMFFSPLLFLSDFKYVKSIPLFRKKEFGTSLVGLLLVIAFCSFMTFVNKMCMSETYFASADAYYESINSETEETTTVEETTVEITSEE